LIFQLSLSISCIVSSDIHFFFAFLGFLTIDISVPTDLKFKVADIPHLANSQNKHIKFFNMADGRHIENRSGHNSAADCPISVKLCVRRSF